MNSNKNNLSKLKFAPLNLSKWKDFEKLFGERGACGGCWCMTWRRKKSDFIKGKGEGNKMEMKKLVLRGKAPGIIAYLESEPIGWCSVAKRDEFPALERSRVLAKVDEKPVWSITCLFVSKPYRKMGVSVKLLKAAAAHTGKCGGKIVEGYPYEIKSNLPDPFVWTGLYAAYKNAGFKEVIRRSKTRPIMRYFI